MIHRPSRLVTLTALLVLALAWNASAAQARQRGPIRNSSGTLVAVDAAAGTISVRTAAGSTLDLRVASGAKILRNGRQVALGALVLGDSVHVQTDRTGLVQKIIARGANGSTAASFQGVVVGADTTAGTLTVRLRDGSERTVTVDASTRISRNGQTATLDSLTAGDQVTVTTRPGSDVATSIIVRGTQQSELEGTITAVSGDQLTIRDEHGRTVTVTVGSATTILVGDRTGTAADLTVGARVHVRYSPATGEASRIEVQEQEGETEEVSGTVSSVDVAGSRLTVSTSKGSLTFDVTSSTTIRLDDRTATLGDLRAGDRVTVRYDARTDTALSIDATRQSGEQESEVNGTVTAVSGSGITLKLSNGSTASYSVDASTIVEIDDHAASLSDVHVGDRVEVTFDAQTMVASKIDVDRSDSGDDDQGDGDSGGDGG